jgi:hypothetical protein
MRATLACRAIVIGARDAPFWKEVAMAREQFDQVSFVLSLYA